MQVFRADGDVLPHHVFDAATRRPAAPVLRIGQRPGLARRDTNLRVAMIDLAVGTAASHIEQRIARGHAHLGAERADPLIRLRQVDLIDGLATKGIRPLAEAVWSRP